jgi:hypothetical protein
VSPADVSVLDALWETRVLDRVVSWIHCFFAGVDSMADFMAKRLADRPDVTVTNGRGAFSSSLAEYILTAALYYNKHITCCQENKHYCLVLRVVERLMVLRKLLSFSIWQLPMSLRNRLAEKQR